LSVCWLRPVAVCVITENTVAGKVGFAKSIIAETKSGYGLIGGDIAGVKP
jgi:hypothetical protein